MLEEVAGQGAVCVAQDVFTIEQLTFAADVAERFIWADFGGNDIAGLRNGIIADSAIADFVRIVNRIHPAKDDARALLDLTAATGAIFERMAGGKINWRNASDDLLQSADWLTAQEYARAAIDAYLERNPAMDEGRN